MVSANDVRAKYLKFFKDRGHVEIPSAPLVPENDPTTLFTSSGMQPLVPYLLGQSHPSGKKLVDSQPSIRVEDIDQVGDNRHTTFFEMLGNWSLGDYFKDEQLPMFYEFLTKELNLSHDRLWVSLFEGSESVPKDEVSEKVWKKLGIPESKIFYYGVKKNWWSRSGTPEQMPLGEIGGPDTEVFYDFGTPHDSKFGDPCHPNCDCGRFMEIGNSVFIQYKKEKDGSLKELTQKNVDFGGGLERLTAAVNNIPDIFEINFFWDFIKDMQGHYNVTYGTSPEIDRSMRIVTDHLRASAMLISSDVLPSNKMQGYVLRKLIRKSLFHASKLNKGRVENSLPVMPDLMSHQYPMAVKNWREIDKIIEEEGSKFEKGLEKGIREIEKTNPQDINAHFAFRSLATYGVPFEVTQELASQKGIFIDKREFENEFSKHQELSRTASAGMFKGGLQNQSEIITKYHTTTHLLHAALRKILGDHVQQKGSNITAERLRFDFSHPQKLTDGEIKKVQDLINQKIDENLPVAKIEMLKPQALAEGAMAFFPEKYPEITSVYTIGDFSKELCGGPHVQSTGEIGRIKITRQEAVSAGVRRIYATAIFQK